MAVKEPAAASRKALRWEEHKQRTRRELLDSARKLFAERGFHATSAADIAAAAGVTERTLFRYFPTKVALVFDEVDAVLPEMLQVIRERPVEEPPYRAICEGIVEFRDRHRDLLHVLVGTPEEITVAERQRALIGLEEGLAGVLRDRYQLPPEDEITAAVWARASIGALRTALVIAARRHLDGEPPVPATGDTVRACFAALEDGRRSPSPDGRQTMQHENYGKPVSGAARGPATDTGTHTDHPGRQLATGNLDQGR